jgi:4'-phosphopantetheinyl transferase EntD
MIERVLPAGISVAEIRPPARDDRGHDPAGAAHPLAVAEARQVAGTAPKRRAEFAEGRACARAALARFGINPGAISSGPGGEPLWPVGFVGSITHCDRYGAAAVGRSNLVAAIGIDAEPDAPLPPGLLSLLTTPQERAGLPRRRSMADPHWDRLLFSAKEAVFKAWYPLTERWIGFDAATVEIDNTDGRSGRFEARFVAPYALLVAGRLLRSLRGQWLAAQGLIVCAVSLACEGPPP